MIDPELTLTDQQRAELNTCMQLRGFEHIQNLALAECARHDVRLKNLDPLLDADYDKKVLQLHAISKAAAQVWQGIMQRLELERAALQTNESKKELKDLKPEDVQSDPTAEMMES
jgi:hypothetical protein